MTQLSYRFAFFASFRSLRAKKQAFKDTIVLLGDQTQGITSFIKNNPKIGYTILDIEPKQDQIPLKKIKKQVWVCMDLILKKQKMVTSMKFICRSDRSITIICIGVIELSFLSLSSGYLVIRMIELSFHTFELIRQSSYSINEKNYKIEWKICVKNEEKKNQRKKGE